MQIDRRSKLSLREFEAEYVATSRPVLLVNATDHWPARSKWTLDWFAERFPNKQVKFDNKTWEIGAFVRDLQASKGSRTQPVPYLKMVKVDEQFQELRGDIGELALAKHNRLGSRLLPRSMRLDRGYVAVFVGTRGSGFRTLHWDYSYLHVFISQILGDKDVIVFRPEDTPHLYPSPDNENLSTLPDPFHVDLQRFPSFANAREARFTIKQGETLFLPGGWWHATYIDQPNIAIAESMLDHFNWQQRADWYMKELARDGVPATKRHALAVYMKATDRLLGLRG
ncbi:MAG: cupin-like domain-containing protein [Kofleriaceae bacterium]